MRLKEQKYVEGRKKFGDKIKVTVFADHYDTALDIAHRRYVRKNEKIKSCNKYTSIFIVELEICNQNIIIIK